MKLGLGTVQFGLDYGVTNKAGRVPIAEVQSILRRAAAEGLRVVDTAAAYGDSEKVLGACLREWTDHHFSLVTKTVPLRTTSIGESELHHVAAGFEASLNHLGLDRVGALLVHHADDLLVPGGGNLHAQLLHWQEAGKVGKIGVSVYDSDQIDKLFSKFDFDVVQLPLSVFDQRLLECGALQNLALKGVEIHARSIFLQGALLMEPSCLPAHLRELRPRLDAFNAAAGRNGMTPLAATLGFIKFLPDVAIGLVGVLSADNLQQCIEAYQLAEPMDYAEFALGSEALIDPRRWPN